MKFAVEAWDPSYGASVESELNESAAEVVLDVEQPVQQWCPVDPDPAVAPPEAVLFVDGVRRVDAQVWVEEEPGLASPALCASYAAGAVCCCREGAHLLPPEVRRGVFSTAEATTDIVTGAGAYQAHHTTERPGVAPGQVLSSALQRALADTEFVAATVARAAHLAPLDGAGLDHAAVDDLLVLDGSLRGRQHLPRTIGYVKTHHSSYLPAQLGAMIATLAAGQRTPVFRIEAPWRRHTWYLRLPCRPGAPWAGIVRVECSAELATADAVTLASRSQVTLGRFASVEFKDSRAPQNLYPIAGLERELRRRLGDPNLVYRALRRAAAEREPAVI
ncbi:hypothetical protein [Pseudonocardia xinjiangensis]|uniref:NurA domain-containing protein n=1 Tax=Pseudonocardia xinjiangensis TaxID=75289 RepID=A0ABX1RIC2_9PSEU|nr:hypothetical protein [Pseudonocardia xinjiangensis]NMH80145.1 hypothetical protein [Pseudonocardia xinjiangensis]